MQQAPRLFRHLAARQIGRRTYIETLPTTTLSDLPSPQGSWKTHHDAKQRKYNAQLVAGFAAVIGSVIFGKAVGFLEFHNELPIPAKIDSYK